MSLFLHPPRHLPARLLEEFSEPLHPPLTWARREPIRGEAGFADGLGFQREFPDPNGVLETAYADFAAFRDSLGVVDTGPRLRFHRLSRLTREEHAVRVKAREIEIQAGDTEGVRRALVWIEDEMLRRGGPFLPLGLWRRKPVIRSRISRCFFGPIRRPPANRDELADDVDYYPESYLNRLAHEGVNVLWLTMGFSSSVPSKLIPEFGSEAKRHLEKLRWTVERCARYGIKLYAFCIEPAALPANSPLFIRHPELKGHVEPCLGGALSGFCTSSEFGKAYVEEATRTLFEQVPGLGGLIVIPVGERFTTCVSIALPESGLTNNPCNCPRCGSRHPYAVVEDTLAAFRRGMDQAKPEAELIAWPYGQLIVWGEKLMLESSRHIPPGVILQHNFESGGTCAQLGRKRHLWDYWLSWPGPSAIFEKTARAARRRGNRVSAKLQVGCSHEIATVPFVPVPGILHAKYRAMHRLGVSAAMQSWHFGNYPSLMTKAAGELSFAPFPESEEAFLLRLARRNWGAEAPRVAKAWALFHRAYAHYPGTHLFGYYGPMQDGMVWPLYLVPRHVPLAPTWKLGYRPSGDYLADCLSSFFTLDEVVILCRRMATEWDQGFSLLARAFRSRASSRDCAREITVARAIGLQLQSGLGILEFYQLRERLCDTTGRPALALLDRMEKIVRAERARRQEMTVLCRRHPLLGFHSEAEDYKVKAAWLRRGIAGLDRLLAKEFPAVRRQAKAGALLFGDYSGRTPRGSVLALRPVPSRAKRPAHFLPLRHLLVFRKGNPQEPAAAAGWTKRARSDFPVRAEFDASVQNGILRFEVVIRAAAGFSLAPDLRTSSVLIDIEPARLRPRIQFISDCAGLRRGLIDDGLVARPPFTSSWEQITDGWRALLLIPVSSAGLKSPRALFRMNLRVQCFTRATEDMDELSWTRRRPLPARLAWGDANPATDYGWARMAKRESLST